jgi:hypothetical protein
MLYVFSLSGRRCVIQPRRHNGRFAPEAAGRSINTDKEVELPSASDEIELFASTLD